MAYWSVFAYLLAALGGILVFLALVADEVQALEWSLELRQRIEAEKKARQQARSEAA
jgi:hypothetical protein